MTAREWVNSRFRLVVESDGGFEVEADNGERAFIPLADAEEAAAREG